MAGLNDFAVPIPEVKKVETPTKYVIVSVELLAQMAGAWSPPVQIRIASEKDGVLELICRRVET